VPLQLSLRADFALNLREIGVSNCSSALSAGTLTIGKRAELTAPQVLIAAASCAEFRPGTLVHGVPSCL